MYVPNVLFFVKGPNIGISILRTGNNTIGSTGPVNTSNKLIMFLQDMFQAEITILKLVNMDFIVIGRNG